MSDNILTTISDIKSRLQKIYEKLFVLPLRREVKLNVSYFENNSSKYIYKPRFSPKLKLIPQDIKLEFIKIVDDIYLYLEPYSPNNLSNLTEILDLSSENQNSLIYLLENDIYQTHEVYGDYLIEFDGLYFKIGYFRRNKIIQKLKTQSVSIDLADFIIKDATHQIQNQFKKMWIIIENEVERCKNRYISQKRKKDEESLVQIKQILFMKECEYLDFKIDMYLIEALDPKVKLIKRKEFLKDVLGLINNKKGYEKLGSAYILIGIGETNGIFNKTHKFIEFSNYQIIRQLMNEFITPQVDLEIDDYFISSENDEIIISPNKTENSDRILMLTFFYKIGTVYELKKRIGKPTLEVNYYYEGTSFIRDGSHTRRITQQDRDLIMNLPSEIEDFEYFQNDKELTTIDYEKINRYLIMIEKGEIAEDMIDNALNTIQNEFTRIRYKTVLEEMDLIIVKKACLILQDFMKDKTEKVRRRIVYALSPLIYTNKTLDIFKKNWFDYLKKLYKTKEYFPDLIRFLDLFGFFKDIKAVLSEVIEDKNVELLDLYENYIDYSKFKQDRFQIIEMLNEKLKNLDPDDKYIKKSILKIIRKVQ